MNDKCSDFSRRTLLGGLGVVALGTGGCRNLADGLDPDADEFEYTVKEHKSYVVLSPDRRLRVEIAVPGVDSGLAPTWQLRLGSEVVLLPSTLGLHLADGRLLGPGARLVGHRSRSISKRWRPPYGISDEYPDRFEELVVQLEDAQLGIEFDLVARAYDAGVALRYVIRSISGPRPDGDRTPAAFLKLAGEKTQFRFVPVARFHASRDEGEYAISAARDLAPAPHPDLTASCDPGALADIPLTAQLPSGLTVVITESDRMNYPRLMLRSAPASPDALLTHLMRFPGRATGYSGPGETDPQETFTVQVPFATPWRVLIVGAHATDVIERASLVQILATPSVLLDTDWIRPGRALRSFRDNTTEGGIACVDFAVRRKLEYIEFDAHWYGDGTDQSDATVPIAGLDIKHVIAYARERNVGVILYVDRVPAMRQLDDILRTYSEWGVAGIKLGFVWEGRQSDVAWIFDVVKKCGDARLIVNLHDNLRPAGLERTLPNYLTMEGVRGNEQFPSARHNVTLPFTRNIAGPIDYTICYANEKNKTTNAHQLAMAVVFYSPLAFLYWYDKPAKYAHGEWPELDFFDDCPTTWDETRAIAGEIGEYVVIARRRGQRWFLGAMTNEVPRDIELSLSFLGPGVWRARIHADGEPADPPNRTPVQIREQNVLARHSLRLWLAPSGGQAVRFELVR